MGCDENSCSNAQCPCGQANCSCPKMESTGCEMTDMIMMLANKAWAEAVVAKMKEIMIKTHGEHINKIAQAGVEAASAYHMHKMEGKQKCEEGKQKIKKAFTA